MGRELAAELGIQRVEFIESFLDGPCPLAESHLQ
jgi:hypothetical protein